MITVSTAGSGPVNIGNPDGCATSTRWWRWGRWPSLSLCTQNRGSGVHIFSVEQCED